MHNPSVMESPNSDKYHVQFTIEPIMHPWEATEHQTSQPQIVKMKHIWSEGEQELSQC